MTILDREEYIEQAYFFKTFLERLDEDLPSQEILMSIKEEILATTKLPLALDVLRGEMLLKGRLCEGMALLKHYFAPFQTFVMKQSEEDRTKFDQRVALQILEREARYRGENGKPAGLFVYQFECLSRNRLGYDRGMTAIAEDPVYDADWREWILKARLQLGTVEFADLIYFRSEYYLEERRKLVDPNEVANAPLLFSRQEGRIAKANRAKILFISSPRCSDNWATRQSPALNPLEILSFPRTWNSACSESRSASSCSKEKPRASSISANSTSSPSRFRACPMIRARSNSTTSAVAEIGTRNVHFQTTP